MEENHFRCETCGSPMVRRRVASYDVSGLVGFNHVLVEDFEATVCKRDPSHETMVLDGSLIDFVVAAVAKMIVEHIPSLTQQEVRFLRKFLECTQTKLGEWLGVDRVTVGRWETGETPMPVATAQAIRGRVMAQLSASWPKLMPRAEADRVFKKPEPRPAQFVVQARNLEAAAAC